MRAWLYLSLAVAPLLLAASPAPAARWEGPWVPVPGGGRFKTTLYYGPWKCRQSFLSECVEKCAAERHPFKGCIWLADMKKEFDGLFMVRMGGRLAITHCCCDYPELDKATAKKGRDSWDSRRDGYRERWSKEHGDWPKTGDENWPGHHVHDIKRGGDPNGWVLPTPKSVHYELTRIYSRCYAGADGWNQAGPEWPYTE